MREPISGGPAWQRSVRKSCVGLVAVLLLVVAAFGPASGQAETGAGTESFSGVWGAFDPVGDVALYKGDITAWRVIYRPDGAVRLAMRLRVGTRITNWTCYPYVSGCRGVRWEIDYDGDGSPDHVFEATANGVTGSYCPAPPSFVRTEPNVYVMRIPSSCTVGSPPFRARVRMYWSNTSHTISTTDRAPNNSEAWSPRVTPS
jgi:hypothetical protein